MSPELEDEDSLRRGAVIETEPELGLVNVKRLPVPEIEIAFKPNKDYSDLLHEQWTRLLFLLSPRVPYVLFIPFNFLHDLSK